MRLYIGYMLQTSNSLPGWNTARQDAKLSSVGFPPPTALPPPVK